MRKNLTFQLAWKIISVIIVLLVISSIVCISSTSKNTDKIFFDDSNELVSETSYAINNRLQMFMQQLRTYTMLNDVGYSSTDPQELQEMLVKYAKRRSKHFKNVAYAEYDTGLCYYDDGRIENVSSEVWFKRMKDENLSQVYEEPFGTDYESGLIPICKATEPKKEDEKTHYGCFVGFVPLSYIQDAVTNIKDGEISNKNGYAVIIDSKGKYIAGPDPETLMKNSCWDKSGIKFAQDAIEYIKSGNSAEILHSRFTESGNEFEIFLKSVSNTTWSTVIIVPTAKVKETENKLTRLLGITIFATAILMSVFVGLLLVSTIKPLLSLNKNIEEISTGNADLTKRLPETTKNEIGQITHNFNSFVAKLQELITDISKSRDNMVSANEEVSQNLMDTHSTVMELDNSISDTESQMKSQVDSVDDTKKTVSDLSQKIGNLDSLISTQTNAVEEASSAVEQMIGNIKSVTKSSEHMNETFNQLKELSEKGMLAEKEIRSIVDEMSEKSKDLDVANKTISNIASQTNLLAMNAAIEASHAGIYGQGFAVVADEIRNLAESSSKQTKEIKGKIGDIKNLIEKIVGAATEADEIYSTTSSEMENTSQIVAQISNAMNEQNIGSQQIIEVLTEMKNVSLGVREAGKEMQLSQEKLKSLADSLNSATYQMQTAVSKTSDSAKNVSEIETKLLTASEKVDSSIKSISEKINGFKLI